MTSPIVDALDGITGAGSPVVSVAPVRLAAPGRPGPLEVRASAPVTGTDLPVVLFSRGNGWNHDGYAPLTAFWASRGFVVVQPTHLDWRRNGFGFDHPVFPTIWTERTADLTRVLDQLDTIEAAVPGLSGRVDRNRVAATGHSWGVGPGCPRERARSGLGGTHTSGVVGARDHDELHRAGDLRVDGVAAVAHALPDVHPPGVRGTTAPCGSVSRCPDRATGG